MESADYNQIIGAGGYGIIIKHDIENSVMKLLYNARNCNESEIEFRIHSEIYEKLLPYLSQPGSQICMSQPMDFSNEPILKFDNRFICNYRMSLIHALYGQILYHIILKEEYNEIFNKEIGRSYSQPVSEKNPSRGFFATSLYIQDIILDSLPDKVKGNIRYISDIIYRMGYLFGLTVFLAEYIPYDVEYVLGLNDQEKLCVVMLDFGMVRKISFNPDEIIIKKQKQKLDMIVRDLTEIRDIDLYFPYSDDYQYGSFLEGFTDAYLIAIERTSDSNIKQNKRYVYETFINT
jgi:hypothetical protein